MDRNFNRLLDILRLVPVQGSISAPELQRRLGAHGHSSTARTIQRDLEALARSFPLECDSRSKPYGWRWAKNPVRLSLPGMEWPEALSFCLLEKHLGSLLPASVAAHLKPYFKQAEAKLGQHFNKVPIQRWPEKVQVVTPGPGLIPPKVKQSVHEAVSEALLSERQVEVDYLAVGQAKPRSHRIHPLGLVLEGNVLYLVASFYDYAEPRLLAMHRISRAVLMAEPCQVPEGFSLQRYVDEGGFGCGGTEMIQLEATWRNFAGLHLLQARLSADQEAEDLPDGVVRIRATVRYTERLAWWLLSFGPNVEVHGPEELRDDIAERHREAARLYSRKKPPPSSAGRAK